LLFRKLVRSKATNRCRKSNTADRPRLSDSRNIRIRFCIEAFLQDRKFNIMHKKRILLVSPSYYLDGQKLLKVRRAHQPNRTILYLAAQIPEQYEVSIVDELVEEIRLKALLKLSVQRRETMSGLFFHGMNIFYSFRSFFRNTRRYQHNRLMLGAIFLHYMQMGRRGLHPLVY